MTSAAASAEAPNASGLVLLEAVLCRFTDIVGEGASYATLHFAAMAEGTALGSQFESSDEALQAGLRFLSIEGKVTSSGESFSIAVQAAPLLLHGHPVLDGVTLGLLEGALKAVEKVPYDGQIDRNQTRCVITLTPRRQS